jgi:hypothetical protein
MGKTAKINKTHPRYLLSRQEGLERVDLKKLCVWDLDEALKSQDEYESLCGSDVNEVGPYFRWLALVKAEELYEVFQNGDNSAILEAIHICSSHSLLLPRWCQTAFESAYEKVRGFEFKSWDDVFGRPHPKNVKIGAKYDEIRKGLPLYARVIKIKRNDPAKAIDRLFFEAVGKEFGISGSLADRYYYKWKDRLEQIE